jgi:hypothetical protein
MESFEHATVTSDGETRPLVARTDTVYWTANGGSVDETLPWATILLWIFSLGGAALTVSEYRKSQPANRRFDAVLFGVVGLVGLVAMFMWLATEHTVTASNLNLLWAWPTHLIAAAVLWRWTGVGWLRVYLVAAAVVNGLIIALWWIWPQDLHPATVPIILLLTMRSAWRAYQLRPRALA